MPDELGGTNKRNATTIRQHRIARTTTACRIGQLQQQLPRASMVGENVQTHAGSLRPSRQRIIRITDPHVCMHACTGRRCTILQSTA